MDLATGFLLFCAYGFLGWLLGVAHSAVFHRRLVHRGGLHAPLSPLYGLGALVVVSAIGSFRENLAVLSLLSFALTAGFQFFSHWALEAVFSFRFWNFDRSRFGILGRIELGSTLVLSTLSVLTVLFLHPFLLQVLATFPPGSREVIMVVLAAILGLDAALSLRAVLSLHEHLGRPEGAGDLPGEAARLLRGFPTLHLPRRAPLLESLQAEAGKGGASRPGSTGLTFAKLFWVYLIAAHAGVVLEVVYGLATTGVVENRSGVVYGVQNPVYGFGAVVMTLVLAGRHRHRDLSVFLASAVIGGLFEYLVSLGQELTFGSVSWEYSGTLLNLQGRTNAAFALLWGLLGLIWVRYLFPQLSELVERIPPRLRKVSTLVFTAAVCLDLAVSAAAVGRWSQRDRGLPATNGIERILDAQFDDAFMEKTYSNMMFLRR